MYVWENLNFSLLADFSDIIQYYQLQSSCYAFNSLTLFILYLKLYTLSPFSQVISPWQPPFAMNLNFILFIFRFYICDNTQFLSFCILLISLSIRPSWSIHLLQMERFLSFLRLNNIHVYVYVCVCACDVKDICHILFIYSSVERQIVSMSWL